MKLVVLLLTALSLLMDTNLYAQAKPAKEKPPTQKEMQELMKQAQKELDNMSDEDKKEMEKMGIKMPSLTGAPNVTDRQLKAAYENEQILIPKKDIKRIALINKNILSETELTVFIKNTTEKVALKLGPEITSSGNNIYLSIKQQYPGTEAVAVVASGCWIGEHPEMALYLMGRACIDDPKNYDNLNNYSAFLTMLGGEMYAVPILLKLNSLFPGNSTILNNIGQAWFGLGDIQKAEIYLDSAIRIYASHSQANLTKSVIEKSKGNIKKSREHLKVSLHTGFSESKLDQLKKDGISINREDIKWNLPMPQDALGISKFTTPPYALSTGSIPAAKAAWEVFREQLAEEVEKLETMANRINKDQQEKQEKFFETANKASSINWVKQAANPGPLSAKARVLFESYMAAPATLRNRDAMTRELIDVYTSVAIERAELPNKIQQAGGLAFELEEGARICNAMNNEFLKKNNTLLEKVQSRFYEMERKAANEMAYYAHFMVDDTRGESMKHEMKAGYFKKLSEAKHEDLLVCPPPPSENKKPNNKLQDYYDLHKDTIMTFKVLGFFSMLSTNNKTVTKWDFSLPLPGTSIGFKGELKQNNDEQGVLGYGRISNCTMEIGASVGVDKANLGVVKAEVKASGSGFIEFDEDNGITDFGVEAGAAVKLGVSDKEIGSVVDKAFDNNPDYGVSKSITAVGVSTRVGWNSGISSKTSFLKL